MKRADQVALSRRRILDGAIEEFSQKGYENASVTAMCQRHQLSKGRVYYHFASKEELYVACARRCIRFLADHLDKAVVLREGDLDGNCRRYFEERRRFFEENPPLRALFFTIRFQTPLALEPDIEKALLPLQEYNDRFAAQLLEGISLREGCSTQQLQRFLFLLDAGFSRQCLGERGSTSLEELADLHEKMVEEGVDLILHGLLKP